MQQAVVCRHQRSPGSAFVSEYWKTRCARWRPRHRYIGGRSYRQAPMHKRVSCTLSRLSSSESAVILRMSECLSGLRPIHLHWPGTGVTDHGFCCSHTAGCKRRNRTTRCFPAQDGLNGNAKQPFLPSSLVSEAAAVEVRAATGAEHGIRG